MTSLTQVGNREDAAMIAPRRVDYMLSHAGEELVHLMEDRRTQPRSSPIANLDPV